VVNSGHRDFVFAMRKLGARQRTAQSSNCFANRAARDGRFRHHGKLDLISNDEAVGVEAHDGVSFTPPSESPHLRSWGESVYFAIQSPK
jgi:hypothetical protein